MVTIKEVAHQAGVSVSTVSYVLNRDPRITPETQDRVMQAVQRLGYTGRSGKKSKPVPKNRPQTDTHAKNVVLCLHSISGPFYSTLITSMQKVFDMNGYHLFIHISDEISLADWIDGFVVLNSQITDSNLAHISDTGIPITLLDRSSTLPEIQNILIDNRRGIYELVTRLIDNGTESFAFVGGVAESYDARCRYDGFCQALLDRSLDPDEMAFIRGDYTRESGMNAIKYLMSRGNLPQAIVCANDEMATGVLEGLSENCTTYPTVTGFDGFELGEESSPHFPTVRVDVEGWGSIAAYSIIERINGGEPCPDDILIPVEIQGFSERLEHNDT